MRIEISHHTDRKGLLFKTTYYVVVLNVQFSHEEKHIIAERRLGDAVLLERRPATAKHNERDDGFALTVSGIVKGPDHFYTANPGDAKAYQAQLLLALEQLKSWVMVNAEGGERIVVEL
jgi:hypothetical protein